LLGLSLTQTTRLWHFVDRHAPILVNRLKKTLELGLVDAISDAFQRADVNVADVVLAQNGLGHVPVASLVQALDIIQARALFGVSPCTH